MTDETDSSVENIPQSVQAESLSEILVETPDVVASPTPANEKTETPIIEVQKPTEVEQKDHWAVQMTYGMLRDLAARGRANIQKRKRAKFEKILAFLDTHGKITTHEVAHFLYVSPDTASRYLSQLEKEGKLKQIGHTGHAVYYVKP